MEQYYNYGIRNFQSVPPPNVNTNLNNNYIFSSLSSMPILPNSIQTPIISSIPNHSNINYHNNNTSYPNLSYPNPNFNYSRSTSPNVLLHQ
jgi:hypothetical protein